MTRNGPSPSATSARQNVSASSNRSLRSLRSVTVGRASGLVGSGSNWQRRVLTAKNYDRNTKYTEPHMQAAAQAKFQFKGRSM